MTETSGCAPRSPVHTETEVTDPVELIRFPLREFELYRLEFESRCPDTAYWVVDFFDAAGAKNYADNYSSIDPAEAWTPHTACFMARAGAVEGVAGFRRMNAPLHVRGVRVTPMTKAETLAWMDASYDRLPPVRPLLPADRWDRLGRLRTMLQPGRTIRWLALGDSLSNDLLNGLGHLLLERAYPGLTILPIHANGPEKSCAGYQADAVLERLVYPHRPDVLMIAGPSQCGQTDAIRTVIAKVRAACGDMDVLFVDVRVYQQADEQAKVQPFLYELDTWGARENFAVIRLTTLFDQYLADCGLPRDYFKRDRVHVNDRGKLVLGKLFASHFVDTDLWRMQ